MRPEPITPGMFGYSLIRAGQNQPFFKALMEEMLAFGVPIEGLHTETGPGVYEAAILYCEGIEAADRAILFKTGAKEIGQRFGIMPSFMAKWSTQYPGCSGHVHQSLSDGKANLFYDRAQSAAHVEAVRELPRRAAGLPRGHPGVLRADREQLQAPGGRHVGAGEAHLERGQPHRVAARDSRLGKIHAAGDALARRRQQSLPRARGLRRGRPVRHRKRASS